MIPIHFVFDIIVTLLECHEIENWHAVKVVAKFGNKQIPITSSRINVSELKTGFGTDMIIGPTRLRKSLEDFGLTMTVSYKNKVIGSCKMILPQQTIDLIGIGMRDIVYSDTCRFGKAGEDVGKLGVLFRLIIKCEELENLVESPCVRNVDTLINEQDIMFVMSDVHRCPSFCEPCHDAFTDDDEADRKLRLDLQRYRSSVGKSQRATDIPTHNVFGELKKFKEECEQIIDSITTRLAQHKSSCRTLDRREQGGTCCAPNRHFLNNSHGTCFSFIPARQGDSPDFCDPSMIPVPISDLNKPDINPPRFCPVCLANMSWVPKLACCPRCGAKAMPVIEERHKEKQLTSEQIITEFLGNPLDHTDDFCEDPCEKAQREKEKDKGCRCTCKGGIICAHCRIQTICADIFEANKVVCHKITPKASEDFFVRQSGSKHSITDLARVLSELKNLYMIKDALRKDNCGQGSPKKQKVSRKKHEPVKLVKSNLAVKRKIDNSKYASVPNYSSYPKY